MEVRHQLPYAVEDARDSCWEVQETAVSASLRCSKKENFISRIFLVSIEEEIFYETEISGKRWNVSQTIKKKSFFQKENLGSLSRIFSEFNSTTFLIALKISY